MSTHNTQIKQLQTEIKQLLDGKEHYLIPALNMHFFVMEKDDNEKENYLYWFKKDTVLEPPYLPNFIKIDKNLSGIAFAIDNAINETSKAEMNKPSNIVKFLQFVKYLLEGEINDIESREKTRT